MKITHGTLVLAADGEKMLLFRNEGDEKYPVLKTVSHETGSAASTHEQGSDRPGRSFSSNGARRSSYSETDWHQQSEERFAIHAALALENAAASTEAGIVVLAPPRTLGILRQHWGSRTRERLLAEIDKDLVHRTTDDVIAAIAAEKPQAESQGSALV